MNKESEDNVNLKVCFIFKLIKCTGGGSSVPFTATGVFYVKGKRSFRRRKRKKSFSLQSAANTNKRRYSHSKYLLNKGLHKTLCNFVLGNGKCFLSKHRKGKDFLSSKPQFSLNSLPSYTYESRIYDFLGL